MSRETVKHSTKSLEIHCYREEASRIVKPSMKRREASRRQEMIKEGRKPARAPTNQLVRIIISPAMLTTAKPILVARKFAKCGFVIVSATPSIRRKLATSRLLPAVEFQRILFFLRSPCACARKLSYALDTPFDTENDVRQDTMSANIRANKSVPGANKSAPTL
jgi:hypothetical protein